MWLHSSVCRESHWYRGGHGFKSLWSPDFFRLLLSSCLNWKIYCDDHSSLSSTTTVQIWIISYNTVLHSHCSISIPLTLNFHDILLRHAWHHVSWLELSYSGRYIYILELNIFNEVAKLYIYIIFYLCHVHQENKNIYLVKDVFLNILY